MNTRIKVAMGMALVLSVFAVALPAGPIQAYLNGTNNGDSLQTQDQSRMRTRDCNCNGDMLQDRNQTRDQLRLQDCSCDCICDGTGNMMQYQYRERTCGQMP